MIEKILIHFQVWRVCDKIKFYGVENTVAGENTLWDVFLKEQQSEICLNLILFSIMSTTSNLKLQYICKKKGVFGPYALKLNNNSDKNV